MARDKNVAYMDTLCTERRCAQGDGSRESLRLLLAFNWDLLLGLAQQTDTVWMDLSHKPSDPLYLVPAINHGRGTVRSDNLDLRFPETPANPLTIDNRRYLCLSERICL